MNNIFKYRNALAVVVVTLAAALPFLPWLDAPFLHDDVKAVVENPLVIGEIDLYRILTSNAWGNPRGYEHIPNYRPLSVISLAITHAFAGLNPVPYRLTNIFFHTLVSLLLLWLMVRFGVPLYASTLAAAWFAAHPVHVETVMFVVNREEIMAALVVLLTFWPKRDDSKVAITAAVMTFIALMCKETAVITPFLLLVWGLVTDRRLNIKTLLASGVVVVVYFLMRLAIFGRFMGGKIPWQDNPLAPASVAERILGGLAVTAEAARLLIAPTRLTIDYGYDVLGLPTQGICASTILGFVIFIAAVIGAVIFLRKAPVVSLGLSVAIISWLPFSNLILPSSIILAERNLYLCSAGVSIAIAQALSVAGSTPARRLLLGVLSIACISIFLLGSANRAGDFRSAIALFSSSLANRPNSTRLHDNLGLALYKESRFVEAEREYRKALAIDPQNADAHNNLGSLLQMRGELTAAAREYIEALRIRPNMVHTASNLCFLLVRAKDDESALRWCTAAASVGADVDEALEYLKTNGVCRVPGTTYGPSPGHTSF